MKNTKKIARCTLALCVVVALSVGGTLAYLSMSTNTKTNTFTFVGVNAAGLDAELQEPAWDALPDADGDGIPDDAESMVPGRAVTKDPVVVNTGTISEYVGLKVSFTKNDGTAYTDAEVATLLANITIDWNTTDWTRYTGTATSAEQYFYYNTALDSGDTTAQLFSQFSVNTDASTAVLTSLSTDGLKIVIAGSAVQTEGIATAAAASTEFSYA